MIINTTYQRIISNGIATIITSLFLLWPVYSFAKEVGNEGSIDIRNFMLVVENDVQQASMFINYQLPDNMRDGLLNGVPLIAKVTFTLGQHHSWWWNTSTKLHVVRFTLKYHALSKHYVITRSDSDMRDSYSTLRAALQQMGKITHEPLSQLKNIKTDENYYLFIQATLTAKTINLPLKVQSYFNKQYQLESEGIRWPIP